MTAASVVWTLRRLGHEVMHFEDGREGIQRLGEQPPDLLLLDLLLPGMDGLEICRTLRAQHPRLPIIMVTSRGDELERVVGLESGADDYIVKPFSLRELEARVKALLRRSNPTTGARGPRVVRGSFVLDRPSGTLQVADRTAALAPREAELLAVLMENAGHVVTREQLLGSVWGENFAGDAKTLDVHIRWLRKKVERDPDHPRHIVTVRGRGYRFELDDVAEG